MNPAHYRLDGNVPSLRCQLGDVWKSKLQHSRYSLRRIAIKNPTLEYFLLVKQTNFTLMDTKQIMQCLKKIVSPYVQNEKAFQDFDMNTDFLKDLEINSANLVDIVLDVEDEFNIEIDNDSMDNMLTVKDAVAIIKEKRAEA